VSATFHHARNAVASAATIRRPRGSPYATVESSRWLQRHFHRIRFYGQGQVYCRWAGPVILRSEATKNLGIEENRGWRIASCAMGGWRIPRLLCDACDP
jgi:hypothetical protein